MCPTFLFLILKEIFGSWKECEVGWGLSDPGKRDETCLLSERQQKQKAARGTEAGFPDRLACAQGWRPLTTTESRGGVVKDTGRSALTTSVEATALSTQMGS